MNKKMTVLFFLVASLFLLASCDSLWMVEESTKVSFRLDLTDVLASKSSSEGVNSISVIPNLQEDDIDDMSVVVSIYDASNNAVLASEELSTSDAQGTDVVFNKLRTGQNVYATIHVNKEDDDDNEEVLFFRARSNNTVLTSGNNILTTHANAVFMKPGVDTAGSGLTPNSPVGTLEEAVRILGGIGAFVPDATVFVEDTITFATSTTWDYPGLIITHNSNNELLKIDASNGSNSEGVTIKGITFKGNPSIETDKSLLHLVKGFLSLEDVIITGFKTSQDNNSGALLIEEGETYVEFNGNVTITNNFADGKPANVVVTSGYEPRITVMGELSESSRISLNFIELYDVDTPLVINEGGTFVKENFIVTDYRTGSKYETEKRTEEGGSLYLAPLPPQEPGTIEFLEEDKNSDYIPFTQETLQLLKGDLVLYNSLDFNDAPNGHTATINPDDIPDLQTMNAYLKAQVESIVYTIDRYGFLVETTVVENTLTVKIPLEGKITFMQEDEDGNNEGPLNAENILKVQTILPNGNGYTWGSGEEAHVVTVDKSALGQYQTMNDLFSAKHSELYVNLSPLGFAVTDNTHRQSILSYTVAPLPPLPETGTIEFYETNLDAEQVPLSDIAIDIDYDGNDDILGSLSTVKTFFSSGAVEWGGSGSEHIATVNSDFSLYAETLVEKALEKGYVVTATPDQNKENTLIVNFLYEGSVVFLDAAGNPLNTPEFAEIKGTLFGLDGQPVPGSWGDANNAHILTITGANVKNYVDTFNEKYDQAAATDSLTNEQEYQKPQIDLIEVMNTTEYLNSFVSPMIRNSMGSDGVTQKGNIITVQAPPSIITDNDITADNVQPSIGVEVAGFWDIAGDTLNLDQSAEWVGSGNLEIKVDGTTTFEAVRLAIQNAISIQNTTTSVSYVTTGLNGNIVDEQTQQIAITLHANTGYEFTDGSKQKVLLAVDGSNNPIDLEIGLIPNFGTIEFYNTDGTPFDSFGIELATAVFYDLQDTSGFTWGTGANAHIATANENITGPDWSTVYAVFETYESGWAYPDNYAPFTNFTVVQNGNTLTVRATVPANETGTIEFLEIESYYNVRIPLNVQSLENNVKPKVEESYRMSVGEWGTGDNAHILTFTLLDAVFLHEKSISGLLGTLLSEISDPVANYGLETESVGMLVGNTLTIVDSSVELGMIELNDASGAPLGSDYDIEIAKENLGMASWDYGWREPGFIWGSGSSAHIALVTPTAASGAYNDGDANTFTYGDGSIRGLLNYYVTSFPMFKDSSFESQMGYAISVTETLDSTNNILKVNFSYDNTAVTFGVLKFVQADGIRTLPISDVKTALTPVISGSEIQQIGANPLVVFEGRIPTGHVSVEAFLEAYRTNVTQVLGATSVRDGNMVTITMP